MEIWSVIARKGGGGGGCGGEGEVLVTYDVTICTSIEGISAEAAEARHTRKLNKLSQLVQECQLSLMNTLEITLEL